MATHEMLLREPATLYTHRVENPLTRLGAAELLSRCVLNAQAKAFRTTAVDVHALRLLPYIRANGACPREVEAYLADTLDALTNGHASARAYNQPPFLVDTIEGVQYRTYAAMPGKEDLAFANGGMTHIDKMPSVLGELAVPTDFGLWSASDKRFTLAELMVDSMARCRPDRELSWTVEMYCRYLASNEPWKNRWDESLSIDKLVQALVADVERNGQCLGTHRIRALAVAWARESATPGFFSSQTRGTIDRELTSLRLKLAASQKPNGAWDERWAGHTENAATATRTTEGELRNNLAATGHLLEAASFLANDHRVESFRLVHACEYLAGELRRDMDLYFARLLPPTTHAVIGLVRISRETGEER